VEGVAQVGEEEDESGKTEAFGRSEVGTLSLASINET